MILCNLSVLLAERHLKISKVSQDTGISRTTLTALANNYGKGLQFDTIDTLCLYLKTTPSQLIAFAPVTIDNIHVKTWESETSSFDVEVITNVELSGKTHECILQGVARVESDKNGIDSVQIGLELCDEVANPDPEVKESNAALEKAFGLLTRIFTEDIAKTVQEKIVESIENTPPVYANDEIYKEYAFSDGYSLSFSWPFDDWGK